MFENVRFLPLLSITSGFTPCQTVASLSRYRFEDGNFKTASV